MSFRLAAFASPLALVVASVYAVAGPLFADPIVRAQAPAVAQQAYEITVTIPALGPEPVPTLTADVSGAGAVFQGFSSSDGLIRCGFPRPDHATCDVPNGVLPHATAFTLTVAPNGKGMVRATVFLDIHTDAQTATTHTRAAPLAR